MNNLIKLDVVRGFGTNAMWRLPFTLRVIALLIGCRNVRKNLSEKPLRLPPVVPERTVGDHSIEQQVRFADRIIAILTSRSGHYCFYRSVALATLFRWQGLPLVINVGGRGLGSPEKMKAHSWLTLDGKPFYERPNAIALYTLDMGMNADGSVRYWVGPEFDDSILGKDGLSRGNSSRQDNA